MSLIYCPECDKEISDKVKACPHCGYPMEEEQKPQEIQQEIQEQDNQELIEVGNVEHISENNLIIIKPKKKKFIVIISLFLILVLFSFSGIFVYNQVQKQKAYDAAVVLLSDKKYEEAINAFNNLKNYKDSKIQSITAYGENFEQTAALIFVQNYISKLKCSYISEKWNDAIDNHNNDFNKAIQTLLTSWKNSGLTKKCKTAKDDIDNKMKTLQNPPDDYIDAYKLIVEMYGIYVQIYDQSITPTGSLLTYNSTIKSFSSDFDKAYNQIIIIRPNIKNKVSEEKKDVNTSNLN